MNIWIIHEFLGSSAEEPLQYEQEFRWWIYSVLYLDLYFYFYFYLYSHTYILVFSCRWHPLWRLLCGPAGHSLAGRLSYTAAVHLLIDWRSLSAGRLHLALSHTHRNEDGRQADGQAGAPNAAHRLLFGPIHIASLGSAGLPVLRILQFRWVDDSVASRHLQALLHTLPGCQAAWHAGGAAHLPDLHGQVFVLHARGRHLQRLALLQQDDGQLAQFRGTAPGQGATHPGPSVRLVWDGGGGGWGGG